MDLQYCEDKVPSYALAKFYGIAKLENGMFCAVDGEKYPSFTEHTQISNTSSSCHITNLSTSMYDAESINEPVKDNCGVMQATNKGKLCCNIKQVDSLMTEKSLSPVKSCHESEANLFFIT